MELFIKKLHEDAILPKYAHSTDAGMDLYSVDEAVIKPGESVLLHTGIAIQLPENTEAQTRPRSGLALKYCVTIINSPGTIDESYRGEIRIILINHGKEDFIVKKGMRIAQMVINPIAHPKICEVEDLDEGDRGSNGFGSTGLY